MSSCPHHQAKKMEANNSELCSEGEQNCCQNKIVHIESEVDQKFLKIDFLNLESQHFAVDYGTTSFTNYFGELEDVIPFVHYKPYARHKAWRDGHYRP